VVPLRRGSLRQAQDRFELVQCCAHDGTFEQRNIRHILAHTSVVIPAKAGIQVVIRAVGANKDASHPFTNWIPAFAGMTEMGKLLF
jgi:hypothetical protein